MKNENLQQAEKAKICFDDSACIYPEHTACEKCLYYLSYAREVAPDVTE